MEMIVIKNSSDPKKIGRDFPQTVMFSKNETDDLEFFSTQKGKRVNRKIKLNNILLSSSARLTDAISCSLGPGNDMIISDKLYNIIKESNLGPIQFFNVSFHYKKEVITNYYWMHFVYELEPLINFKITTYNDDIFPELKKKIITDYDSYKKFCEEKDRHGFLRSKNNYPGVSFVSTSLIKRNR